MTRISVITSLYHSEHYLEQYLNYVIQIDNSEETEVLLLINEPSAKELHIINSYTDKYPFLKLILIPEREDLYKTWNRGINLSHGTYCTIWNVDDIRLPDSLRKEADVLDVNPECGMTYGNYILTEKYGETEGFLVDEIDVNYNFKEAYRSHIVGCFPMWRKSIHKTVGYFDEQFKLVADYEFQIRTAYSFPLVKTKDLLGYFLHGTGGEGRLSQRSNLQNTERTAVEIRYGLYDKINLLYWKSARSFFNTNQVYSFNSVSALTNYVDMLKVEKSNMSYLKSICKLPINILRYLKHSI